MKAKTDNRIFKVTINNCQEQYGEPGVSRDTKAADPLVAPLSPEEFSSCFRDVVQNPPVPEGFVVVPEGEPNHWWVWMTAEGLDADGRVVATETGPRLSLVLPDTPLSDSVVHAPQDSQDDSVEPTKADDPAEPPSSTDTNSTETSAREFLEKHPSYDKKERTLDNEKRVKKLARIKPTKLLEWLKSHDENTRFGVRDAWMLGRVLNAQRASLPRKKGAVKAWEEEKVAEFGKKPRILQLYRQVAHELDDPKISRALKEHHLNDGLNAVLRRIKNVKTGLDPDFEAERQEPTEEETWTIAKDSLNTAANKAEKLLGEAWMFEWMQYRLGEHGTTISKGEVEPDSAGETDLDQNESLSDNARAAATPSPNSTRPLHLIRSPLIYLGGKAGLWRNVLEGPLRRALSGGRRLVETHAGGAAVSLNALNLELTDKVLLSDGDPAICDFWNLVIGAPEELQRRIRGREMKFDEVEERLVWIREHKNDLMDGENAIERAFWKLVSHRCTFRGMGPIELRPQMEMIEYWNNRRRDIAAEIRNLNRLLKGHVVDGKCVRRDALENISVATVDEFLFLDPPYWTKEASDNPECHYVHGYSIEDHYDLRDALQDTKADWLLTYGNPSMPNCAKEWEKLWRDGGLYRPGFIQDIYKDKDLFSVTPIGSSAYALSNQSYEADGHRELLILPRRLKGLLKEARHDLSDNNLEVFDVDPDEDWDAAGGTPADETEQSDPPSADK